MFVGYADVHSRDVYRMYHIGTKGIKVTWDVIWLGKMYESGRESRERNFW